MEYFCASSALSFSTLAIVKDCLFRGMVLRYVLQEKKGKAKLLSLCFASRFVPVGWDVGGEKTTTIDVERKDLWRTTEMKNGGQSKARRGRK